MKGTRGRDSNKKIDYNNQQIKSFHNTINKIINKNRYKFHLLNSGGLFNYSDETLNIVRLGLSIYGISPLGEINNLLP